MGPDPQDIVIPISITVPDPRPRMAGGRHPPLPHRAGLRDPGWFRRHYGQPAGVELTQWAAPFPLPLPPLPMPDETDAATDRAIREALERAKRRAQEIEQDIARGDYGAATGHLLGGQPFTAEVDDPWTLDHDGPRATIEDLTKSGEEDVDRTLGDPLDERHRDDARKEMAGEPFIDSSGRRRYHDEEVANAANHMEDIAMAVDGKIEHDRRYGDASPESIERAKALSNRIRPILSDLEKEIPGLDKLRDEVRNAGTIERPGRTPDS